MLAAGAGALGAGALGPGRLGAAPIEAEELGLRPGEDDQSARLQKALRRAAERGRDLRLPAGRFILRDVELPPGAGLIGRPGQTELHLAGGGEAILTATDAAHVRLSGLHLSGRGGAAAEAWSGLLAMQGCTGFSITSCTFTASASDGILLEGCAGHVRRCRFSGIHGAAISGIDSAGLWLTENEISECGNLGIYIARESQGHDGTVIRGNRISAIDWKDGGDGQNGNGINVFRAGSVVVADNVIHDCAFSAVRLNATENCQVTGNLCSALKEVAIFSEFGFSASIIADNIIDGAAEGISITNFDSGGRLATCSGNILRNIYPSSPTNPDTVPVGISAEADTAISGNLVENVPGVGISLGWGPYLRDVSATGNILRGCRIGIGVSVAEGAGPALIANNLIRRAEGGRAIAAMLWDEVTGPDLAENPSRYRQLSISGNTVTG